MYLLGCIYFFFPFFSNFFLTRFKVYILRRTLKFAYVLTCLVGISCSGDFSQNDCQGYDYSGVCLCTYFVCFFFLCVFFCCCRFFFLSLYCCFFLPMYLLAWLEYWVPKISHRTFARFMTTLEFVYVLTCLVGILGSEDFSQNFCHNYDYSEVCLCIYF